MALSVGDAVLTFLGDTTQLDQAFNKIATEAGEKLGLATGAVQGTTTAVDEMTKSMAVGQNGAVELGTVMNLAGEESRESMYQARGEAGLLGEMFGIHLPRHVRSFIAELPGVGAALSAAFTATAILFLIDALAQGIEKITQWAEHGEKIKLAWEQYDQTIFESSTHMQAEIDKQEQKLIEMTQGPLAALEFGLKHMASTASETFGLITKDVEAAVKAMNEASSSLLGIQFNVFKDAGKDLETFRSELQKTMREASLAAPGDPFASYKAGIELVQEKERELTALIKQRTAASGLDASAAVNGLHAERQAVNDMLPLLEQGVRLQKEKQAVASQAVIKEAGKEELKLVQDLDKAHKELNKELEKGADEVSKHVQAQLSIQTKAEEKAADEKLRRLREVEDGQIAIIDGEIRLREQAAQRDAEILKGQYDRRELTGQQYLGKLRALYQQEQADLIAMLNRKEQFVILEAQNEAAQKGRILTTEEAKELKSVIDLETKKAQIRNEYDNKFLKTEEQVTTKIAKEYATLTKLLDDYVKHLRAAEKDLQGFGKVANGILGDVSNAFGSAIESWLSGQESFGKAMEKALAQYLIQVAGKAAIDALYFAAWGIADSFWNPPRAGADFAAAAEFAAIAAVAGAAGAALGSASKGGGGSSGQGPQVDQSNPNNQPGQNPQQGGRNVPHLSGGGLVTGPTLAMIGEGGSREAVLPLDSAVMDAIGEAIARHHAEVGSGTTHIWQVKGMVSSDTAGKLMKKMSRQVQTGRARLLSNNALKTTRRA